MEASGPMYMPYAFYDDFPPPPPTKAGLMALLKAAVRNKDVEQARKVFDTAFWCKIEIVPDWHHLLVAVAQKDRPMVQLLAAHGADWTEEQARCLKEIFSPQWNEFSALLKSAGVAVSLGEGAQSDILAGFRMRYHILAEAKDSLPLHAWELKKKETDEMLTQGVVDCLGKKQVQTALELMRLRQPLGALPFEQEFKKIMSRKDVHHALDALDSLRRAGADIRLFTLDAGTAMFYPEAIAPLHQRGLLAASQPCRMQLISGILSRGAYTPADRSALSALFGYKSAPLSEAEADDFVRNYRAAAEKGMPALGHLCADLKAMDFFDSLVWTTGRLRAISEKAPEGSLLKREFNRKLAHDRFAKMAIREILKPENFTLFVEAHRQGYYQASFHQATDLLLVLQGKYDKGFVPEEIKAGLRVLKDCGVHFGTHHYSAYYLGSSGPGMAKVLLDLGILKPENFNLYDLREKAGLPKEKERQYWHKEINAYAEFYFQVYLEQLYSDEFIPQRGKVASYHRCFKERVFGSNPPPPPPPPPKPRKWWPW